MATNHQMAMREISPDYNSTVVVEGLAAHALIADEKFQQDWISIHDACPWATSFQSADFVVAWYRVYKEIFDPIIVRKTDENGDTTGLLTLARERSTGQLVVAGAHQAEYQTWLSNVEESHGFIVEALDLLQRDNHQQVLNFKFLPSGTPTESLEKHSRWRKLIHTRRHKRPLLVFGDGAEIAASLKNKSNKSRLNRLRRRGELEFRECSSAVEFEAMIDEIAAHYDFRQGAVNGTTPFKDDPLKKPFLIELMKSSGTLHVSMLMLDDRPIAAVIGNREKDGVSIGVFSHSPFHAKNSPGKFQLLMLGDLLAKQGFAFLDLTPGGEWKDRFATEWDEVTEMTVHFGRASARNATAVLRAEALASRICRIVGISTTTVRSLPGQLRKISVKRLRRKIMDWLWHETEFLLYSMDVETARLIDVPATLSEDNLSHLLYFEPFESWQTRQAFLSQALVSLEAGDHVLTLFENGALVHAGWRSEKATKTYFSEVRMDHTYPPGSADLYDSFTAPAARGRGLFYHQILQHMKAASENPDVKRIYCSVLSYNGPSRHVVDKIGFRYDGSFFRTVRAGVTRRWSDIRNDDGAG